LFLSISSAASLALFKRFPLTIDTQLDIEVLYP
jgi:hypothetical protein